MMVGHVVSFTLLITLQLGLISAQAVKKTKSAAVKNASCSDTISYCKQYIPYCRTHMDRLKGRCDKTCRYCGPKICDDRRPDCKDILGFCSSLKGMCDKSCGHCGDKTVAAAIRSQLVCRDRRPDCHRLSDFCMSHESSMRKVCTKTCDFCGNPSQERLRRKLTVAQAKGKKNVIATAAKVEECRDRGRFCKHVQKYCHTQAPMKRACAKTCGFCGGAVKAATAVKAFHDNVCRDERGDCKYMTSYCEKHAGMKRACRKTCGFCGGKKPAIVKKTTPAVCRDERNDCKRLQKFCVRYKRSMSRSCKLTCGYCGKRTSPGTATKRKPQLKDNRSMKQVKSMTKRPPQDNRSIKQVKPMTRRPPQDNRSTKQVKPMTKRPPQVLATARVTTFVTKTPPPAQCVDRVSQKNCYLLKKYGKCNGELKRHCLRTCGVCKDPKPKSCENTKYGCCWNKKTIKKDIVGSNCPPCKDKYKSLCDALKKSCSTISYARRVCVKSCGTCT